MMEASLVIGLMAIGAVVGGLIVAAWKSDSPASPIDFDQYGSSADLEQRVRRVQ